MKIRYKFIYSNKIKVWTSFYTCYSQKLQINNYFEKKFLWYLFTEIMEAYNTDAWDP